MTVGLVAIAVSSLGTAVAAVRRACCSPPGWSAHSVGPGVMPAAFVDAVERPSQDQRRRGTSLVIVGAAAAP